MKDCIKASADTPPLAPNQRVNYAFGMVLGETDFGQEQAHFEWKQRLNNRLLHGYGTVCGLRVSAQALPDGKDVEIHVSPGYAISPQGRWIWMEYAQCGKLNEWLQLHKNELGPAFGPGRHRVYVTLGYDECLTAPVPIASRACASDEESRASSRIMESFQLRLAWQPPPQPYEDAMRALGELLRRVDIVPGPVSPPGGDSELLLERVRDLGLAMSPPPLSPPDSTPIQLPREQAYDTLSRLLAIWATEVCPRLEPLESRQGPHQDGSLLLAAIAFDVKADGNLDVRVDAEGKLIPDSITVDDRDRPVLVSDRLQQALLGLIGQSGRPAPTLGEMIHGSGGRLRRDGRRGS